MQIQARSPSPHSDGLPDLPFALRRKSHPALVATGSVALVAAVALRFWARSALWLDETLSVNISRLPLSQIPGALSHDGAPPLYYFLLHFWMDAFGASDFAVRAFSGVTSVATLPFFWLAGRRLGGRRVAWVALFLAATSPFAINYATTARMYSLMILLSVLGFLALARAWEDPTPGRLFALGGATAALLYTHYWGIYLIGATGAWVLWRVATRGQGRLVLSAMVSGVVAWLPWAPVFVYQTFHTGTPWTASANPGNLLPVFADFSGGGAWGTLLMFGTFALFIIGTFGRTVPAGTTVVEERPDGTTGTSEAGAGVLIELKPRPGSGPLVAVAVGTLVIAVVLGALANAAFVARYTAVVLPLFVLVFATGVAVIPGRRFRVGCVVLLCLAGLLSGRDENSQQRTQAVQVAAILNAQAQPGDLVVYCPDQLGPAVDRLLTVPGLQEITFPRAIGPQRVDWVDYKAVIARTDVSQFAEAAVSRGAGHTIWLVWRDGYPGLGGDCGYLNSWLNLLRPQGVTLVHQRGTTFYEYENLARYAG